MTSWWEIKWPHVPQSTSSKPQRRSSEPEVSVGARSVPLGSLISSPGLLSGAFCEEGQPQPGKTKGTHPSASHERLGSQCHCLTWTKQGGGWMANTEIPSPAQDEHRSRRWGAGAIFVLNPPCKLPCKLQEVPWGSEAFSLRSQ